MFTKTTRLQNWLSANNDRHIEYHEGLLYKSVVLSHEHGKTTIVNRTTEWASKNGVLEEHKLFGRVYACNDAACNNVDMLVEEVLNAFDNKIYGARPKETY